MFSDSAKAPERFVKILFAAEQPVCGRGGPRQTGGGLGFGPLAEQTQHLLCEGRFETATMSAIAAEILLVRSGLVSVAQGG